MLGVSARPVVAKVIAPLVGGLARAGVTPDMVTIAGTVGARRLGAVLLFGTGHLFWGTVVVTVCGAARPARRRPGPGPRRRLGVRGGARLRRRPGRRRRHLRRAGLVVLRRGRQPAAGPARAALPGARRPDLLRQGARRGRRASRCDVGIVERLERLLLVLFGTGPDRARRARTRCTWACGCCSPAARSPWASGSSPSTAGGRAVAAAAASRPTRHRDRARAGPASPPASTDAGFAAGWRAVRMLPEPAARGAFDRGGRWAAGRDGKGTRQLRANLRVVTGGAADRGRARRAHHRGRCAPTPATGRRPSGCRPLGTERIVAGHRGRRPRAPARRRAPAGAGLVMALPHSGNWDAAGVWFVDYLGGPFMTVAERLKPESLYRRFLDYRESLGFRVVPLTGGPRPSTEVLREWLADGGVDLPAGRPQPRPRRRAGRASSAGRRPCPAARRCSPRRPAPRCVPTVCQFTERGWRLVFSPEIPVDGPGRLQGPGGRRDAGGRRRVRRSRSPAARGLAHARPDLARRAARPAARGPARARPDAHRPGLPVPVGRPRRGPVPRPRPRRDAARHGPPRRGAHPGRARGVAAEPSGSPSPGAPCRSPTTARWPACSSARCRPPGCAAGCARGTSTSSTCTSRRRRRCRCWSA